MKILVCTLLLSFLFVTGGMAAETAPVTPPTPTADAAFFCTLAEKAEPPVTKIFGDPVSQQEKSTGSDCAMIASECLRANCECSEICGGSVAQSPCVSWPRQWRDCICA